MEDRVVEKRTTISNEPDSGKTTNVNVGEDGTTNVQTDDDADGTTRTVRKETTVTKEVG